jgi:hypothetical protein
MSEKVSDFGCEFNVYRRRSSKKVISISMWKGSPGYIFNLSTSILWWGRNAEILFPGWNIRFYVDYSVYQKKFKDDVDWDEIIQQVKKHYNIELWLTFCTWGQDTNKCEKCHIGTFMSLIRFHAMTDPTVDIAVMKNMELLTSAKDARLIHDWVNSGKKYYIVYDPGYFCNYGNKMLCEENKLTETNMILATFGVRNGPDIDRFSHRAREIILRSHQLSKYLYGVDEIILTLLIKPLLRQDNTYISLRTRSNQWIPGDENYNDVFGIFFSVIADGSIYTEEEKIIIQEHYKYGIFSNTEYQPRLNNQIIVTIGSLSDIVPDAVVEIFKKVKELLQPMIDLKKLSPVFEDMQRFYFNMFINNTVVEDFSSVDTNFFANASNSEEGKLFTYLGINTVLFENIDWPGYSVKRKFGIPKKPEGQKITTELIAKKAEGLKKQYKLIRRAIPNDEILQQRAEENMIADNQRELDLYNKNIKIFKKNIRNKFLITDQRYN